MGSQWLWGDLGFIPGLGRSPGEGKGYSLQYSGLENSMDSIGHGFAMSRTQLSDFTIITVNRVYFLKTVSHYHTTIAYNMLHRYTSAILLFKKENNILNILVYLSSG